MDGSFIGVGGGLGITPVAILVNHGCVGCGFKGKGLLEVEPEIKRVQRND